MVSHEWLPQSPDLNSTESLYWDLKKVVAAQKPKNSKLEAIAEGECAKISQEHFQRLVSCYASCLQRTELSTKDAYHESLELF